MQRVVCPGSFDPVTNGHLDIISGASGLYDEVIVAVLINVTKHGLFTVDERVEMLTEVTAAPGRLLSRTLRSELPRVVPKPGSSGSISKRP